MSPRVRSRSNPAVAEARRLLRDPALRRSRARFVAEGVRLVEEAIRSGIPLVRVLHSPRLAGSARGIAALERARRSGAEDLEVEDAVLDSIADVETSQGMVAVLERPEAPRRRSAVALSVLLDRVRDPGNLGTVARTAEAAGAGALRVLPGSVDWTNPKALRAAMGSLFRIPVIEAPLESHLLELRRHGARIAAADPRGGVEYDRWDWTPPVVLALGGEAEGLSAGILAAADARLRIPLESGVESLNVGAAAAVLLFEAARRRRERDPRTRR